MASSELLFEKSIKTLLKCLRLCSAHGSLLIWPAKKVSRWKSGNVARKRQKRRSEAAGMIVRDAPSPSWHSVRNSSSKSRPVEQPALRAGPEVEAACHSETECAYCACPRAAHLTLSNCVFACNTWPSEGGRGALGANINHELSGLQKRCCKSKCVSVSSVSACVCVRVCV